VSYEMRIVLEHFLFQTPTPNFYKILIVLQKIQVFSSEKSLAL